MYSSGTDARIGAAVRIPDVLDAVPNQGTTPLRSFMPSMLTLLARSWADSLTAGRCEPALPEFFSLRGWPDIVRAVAAGHLTGAHSRALYAAGMPS